MTEFEGQIWVVVDKDNANLVCMSKRAKNKIQAVNEKGRELRLSEDKLLWQHPRQVKTVEEGLSTLATIQTHVDTLRANIDISLLWESALELQVCEMDDLADLYFGGEITTEHLLALWQALAQDRLYFKRRDRSWDARTSEQVNELKQQRKREHHRAQEQAQAQEWLQKVSKLPLPPFAVREPGTFTPVDIPEALVPFVARLEAWLRGDSDKMVEELVSRLANELKLNPRELVFETLLKTARLPLDTDRDVVVAGLKPEFSAALTQAAEAIQPWLPGKQQPVIELFFSIDDEETREVDDALAIEAEGAHWKITIAIADPATLVHRGDLLDREAIRRGTTVYLPTQTVLMLPPAVSCDKASLTAEQIRSALVIRAWFDNQGQLVNSEIQRQPIKVLQRLHYSDADQLIQQGQGDCAQPLQNLLTIAQQLRAQRIAAGAFTLQRPEYKVRLYEGQVQVTMIERDSPSRLLVAEMMILANYIAAQYAHRHQLPIIYRIQEPPLEPMTDALIDDPLSFYKIRKLLRASTLSLQPGGHSGLGLSMYTQLSSPLRRFADLVMQRQLMAHLMDESLPYNQDELYKVLETAERTAREARLIEGEAKKRWFSYYLKQSPAEQTFDSLVIEGVKGGYRVELLPWGVDAFLSSTQTLEPGSTVTTVVDKVRVKAANIRLKLAS